MIVYPSLLQVFGIVMMIIPTTVLFVALVGMLIEWLLEWVTPPQLLFGSLVLMFMIGTLFVVFG